MLTQIYGIMAPISVRFNDGLEAVITVVKTQIDIAVGQSNPKLDQEKIKSTIVALVREDAALIRPSALAGRESACLFLRKIVEVGLARRLSSDKNVSVQIELNVSFN